MSGARKSRAAMLDSLAAASPAPPTALMGASRALRSAREAVDAHKIWDLDPALIGLGARPDDRFDPSDVEDLRRAMETNGQVVPILVRRDPAAEGRYLLVYGRRRLEAVRRSDRLATVRALVAQMDEDGAVRAQIGENAARRDLTFIEKACFAASLVEAGFGTRAEVAEVLGATPSAISMALGVVERLGPDLVRAIGPAPGIGRPRWQELVRRVEVSGDRAAFAEIAVRANAAAAEPEDGGAHPSTAAFEAVLAAASPARAKPSRRRTRVQTLLLAGADGGRIRRTDRGLQLELTDAAFADWVERHLAQAVQDLHRGYAART